MDGALALDKMEERLARARKVDNSDLCYDHYANETLPASLTEAQRSLIRQGWDAGFAEAMSQSIWHLDQVREDTLAHR